MSINALQLTAYSLRYALLPLPAAADARRSYAAYQAMWTAVGETERKPRWEHFGLMKAFVRGRWFDPQAGMRGTGVFQSQRLALHRLYNLRLKADHRLGDIGREEAQWAVDIAQAIITLSEQQKDISKATQDSLGVDHLQKPLCA